jgi:hypothetical protein
MYTPPTRILLVVGAIPMGAFRGALRIAPADSKTLGAT